MTRISLIERPLAEQLNMATGMNLPMTADAARSDDSSENHALSRFENSIERISERLNPILVKEARQALKSNQFVITFLLLLAFGWGWSIFGVVIELPDIRYAPSGVYMLAGYFLIMLVPMLVIVPFSAFRSLATEREDGTFELMSITTLSARQIVTGKLGSALLQMLIYFSAISPCIAFTYLLRGIDIVIILFILMMTMLISFMLTTFGLLFATVSRSRHWQTLLSVILIMGLFVAAWAWGLFTLEAVLHDRGGMPTDDVEFWLVLANVVTMAIAISVMMIQAAAAQITFASDNASTPLRRTMFATQLLFAGWFAYWLSRVQDVDILMAVSLMASAYWGIMGGLMVGESARLSPRVRRALPQSLVGRMFFSLFNPGSATGYLFAVTNLGALFACTAVAGAIAEASGMRNWGPAYNWLWVGLLGWSYVTFYVGITRILIRRLARYISVSPPLALLLNWLLLLFGSLGPLLAESAVVGFRGMGYSELQMLNWAWTLAEATDRGMRLPTVMLAVPAAALLVLAINLIGSRYEIDQVGNTERH